jgi:hypothetical protein
LDTLADSEQVNRVALDAEEQAVDVIVDPENWTTG